MMPSRRRPVGFWDILPCPAVQFLFDDLGQASRLVVRGRLGWGSSSISASRDCRGERGAASSTDFGRWTAGPQDTQRGAIVADDEGIGPGVFRKNWFERTQSGTLFLGVFLEEVIVLIDAVGDSGEREGGRASVGGMNQVAYRV